MNNNKLKIAVIGGTGAEGSGLALRWAHAGHHDTIGSRSAEKARQTAGELNKLLGVDRIAGADNRAAAESTDIVVLAVPFSGQMQTVRELKGVLPGRILVDVTVPLVPPKVGTVQLPPGGSCVVAVQAELGPDVRVVSAFQNVSAHKLKKLDQAIACDVLVCSDDREARTAVIGLARDAGLRGIDAGPLANSAAAEALTSLLICINRAYKIPDAGIAITGLPASV
jgi:hypothetical protein